MSVTIEMPILRSSTINRINNNTIKSTGHKDVSITKEVIDQIKAEKMAKTPRLQKTITVAKMEVPDSPLRKTNSIELRHSSSGTPTTPVIATLKPVNGVFTEPSLSVPPPITVSLNEVTTNSNIDQDLDKLSTSPSSTSCGQNGHSLSGRRQAKMSKTTHQSPIKSHGSTQNLLTSCGNAISFPVKELQAAPVQPSASSPRTQFSDHLSSLELVMREQGCYETTKGLEARKEVLDNLNPLVREWIKSIGLSRGVHWHNLDNIGGRIVTYGSYMLGISHQDADIDALCVAPNFISRKEYFTSFYSYLSHRTEVTELRAIEEAFVPVIKFRYNGIEIDMTFAQLNVEQVPSSDDDLVNKNLFNASNLDLKCLRSLNGYRATRLIMKCVSDLDKFRVVLRAVKLWAKAQGIYSNILGFLGGFSWAVLVARVCMDYPNLSAPELIQKFFYVYKTWAWPEPVALIPYQQEESSFNSWDMSTQYGCNYASSWNPEKNVQERFQVMPILTPTYPHQNSTFNVTTNTLKLIKEKMCVAEETCNRILEGKDTWETLFQTCHMFHEYEHFLIVVASAPSSSPQSILWFGLIESKIRHLVNSLEKECRSNLESARIWPKPFSKAAEKTNTSRHFWFIGLKFRSEGQFDYSRPMQTFHETLLKQSVSFFSREMKVEAHYVLKSDLNKHISIEDVQEIVSSQSQKAREAPMSYHSSKYRSSERHACVESKNSSSYAAVVNSNEGSQNFSSASSSLLLTDKVPQLSILNPPLNLIPFQPPPMRSFLASPRSNHQQRIHIPHQQHFQHHAQRSPIMERSWGSGTGQAYMATTLGPKYNFDRCVPLGNGQGGGHVEFHERLGSGGDPNLSPNGLDVSYSSLESETGRSVSYSSDKFPPQVLIHARLHQLDRIPTSQYSHNSGNYNGCGVSMYGSTPTYDSSVPPPPSPNLAKGPSFSASSMRPMGLSSQQRMSATEIRDVQTPQPIQSQHYQPLRFNFQTNTLQQMQAAHDTVFN